MFSFSQGCQGSIEAGSSCHGVKAQWHPGPVTSSSQGNTERQATIHSSETHLRTISELQFNFTSVAGSWRTLRELQTFGIELVADALEAIVHFFSNVLILEYWHHTVNAQLQICWCLVEIISKFLCPQTVTAYALSMTLTM